jgi:hypothetical protein
MDHGTVHGMSLPPLLSSSISRRKPRRQKRRKRLMKRGICFTYATMFALESLAIAGETHENSAAVRRACDFLVSKQMEDGGWGETYMVRVPASTLLTLRSSILFDPPSSTLHPICTHHHLVPCTFARILTIPRVLAIARIFAITRVLANARQSCVSMEYAQHPQSQVVQTSWAVLALIYGEYPDVEVIKKACTLLMSRQKEDGRWEQEDTEGIFNKNCAIDYPGMSFLLPPPPPPPPPPPLLFNSPLKLPRSIEPLFVIYPLSSLDPLPIGSYYALEVPSKFL